MSIKKFDDGKATIQYLLRACEFILEEINNA
jgi:hypothetical protein